MKVTNWLSKFERRSSRRRVLASLAAAGVAGMGSLAQADTSTTLTGLTAPGNVPVPINHGSNAEVTLTWDQLGWDQYGTLNYAGGWNGRGNVYQMEYNTQTILFNPVSNASVTIGEFFLDEWAGGTNTSSTWSVRTQNNVIASGTWNLKDNVNDPGDAGGRDLIVVNAVGPPGRSLLLEFTNLDSNNGGGYDSYLAMDNLVFSTTIVPEPATAVMAWMGIGGLGAMAMRRKRK
ncbi:MAG: PEP-CTERM sorting domain-containing protein [Pirellulales bacterium]